MSEDHAMPTPPDGRCGDAAIYLLGLLDEQQSARFTAHADSCAVCRDEVGALAPAVDLLPATVPQLDAPEHVKRRVMTVVRAEATLALRPNRPTCPARVARALAHRASALPGRDCGPHEGCGARRSRSPRRCSWRAGS